MYQKPLKVFISFFRSARLQGTGEYLTLHLKHSNRAIYTSRVLWSDSIMSSITANDKDHPLGECHLIAYPVTAVSIRVVSNCLQVLGLAATRIINNLYLTHETSQEVRRELGIKLWISNCIFHKTNNSQRRQDVVATPHTTTLIYTPPVQAETDVHGLKTEI